MLRDRFPNLSQLLLIEGGRGLGGILQAAVGLR